MNDEAVPLQPGREYDLPVGPHENHAAALHVFRSEADGPASLERGTTPDTTLIESESLPFQRANALGPGAALGRSTTRVDPSPAARALAAFAGIARHAHGFRSEHARRR